MKIIHKKYNKERNIHPYYMLLLLTGTQHLGKKIKVMAKILYS
jgi:hypothetical protein